VLEALGTDADDDSLTAEFAVWPVGDPDARTVYTDDSISTGWVGSVTVPAGNLVEGKSYAWQARVTDGTDTSPWSKKCYFSYDDTNPPAPGVTSGNFPGPNGPSPVGEYPVFTFDGHGDKDVAGFEYRWYDLGVSGVCENSGDHGQLECTEPFSEPNTVKANTPGGTATVTLNPDTDGTARLAVRSLDAAGNASPTVYYGITVPYSAPDVSVEGPAPRWGQEVLLKFTPNPSIAGVTGYEIVRDGETGVAYYGFTPMSVSGARVTVRSRSANGFVSAPNEWQVYFDPGPGVTSDIYDNMAPEPTGGVGVTGTFTFSPPPGWTDVAGYRYTFADDESGQADVPAGADGTATISWTPTASGFTQLTVWAVKADGTRSDYPNWYWFTVAG
jgi:hypothetical protein